MRKCHFCAEEIQDAAIVCKHCGRDLIPGRSTAPIASAPVAVTVQQKTSPAAKFIAGLVVLAMLSLLWAYVRDTPPPVTGHRALGTPSPAMNLFVTVRLDGIQITNEAEATWDQCQVTIAGGYSAPIALLRPRDSARLTFDQFKGQTRDVPAGEGYVRGKQRIDVACSGSDYEHHTQSFTAK